MIRPVLQETAFMENASGKTVVISLVDTGGIEPMSQDVILSQMRTQAQIAIDASRCHYYW